MCEVSLIVLFTLISVRKFKLKHSLQLLQVLILKDLVKMEKVVCIQDYRVLQND